MSIRTSRPRTVVIAAALAFALAPRAEPAHAVDLKNPRGWLKETNNALCEDLHDAVRAYYDGGYTDDNIVVTYCNRGAYVIQHVRLEIHRESDKAKIYEKKLEQNLTAGWGHVFLVDGGGYGNAGETYKMELHYNIATGDRKQCTRKFTYNTKDVLWMVSSEGTKWAGNGCKGITFKQR
jgi:hypothetical protein